VADVFISYSHVDNESASADDANGWIDRFELAFSTKLRQLCGATTEVWRDHKIDGSDLLTPTIEDNVRRARLFLSIFSQSYLESEWCRTELRIFAEAARTSGGLRVGTKSRILKVLKTPVDQGTESRAEIDISDLIGYPFFRKREDGKYWEYDPVLGQQAREEFHRQVLELAIDAKALLDALKGGVEEPAVAQTGTVIYLAQAADDLTGDAERLGRELRMLGHTVLPDVAPRLGAGYEQQVLADLDRSHIAIHPVGKGLGAMPEASDRRIVPLQYTLAQQVAEQRRASGAKELARLVWMPPEARTDELADVAFRDALDTDAAVRKCTLESVKSAIATLIAHEREPAKIAPGAPAAAGQRTQIYLIFDQEDTELAQPFAEHLVAQGYAVTLPIFDGDEAERRADHDDTLCDCDAVIILHASATDFWRRAKLRDLKRAFGHGRGRPFVARAIVLLGAAAAGGGDALDPDLIVIRGSENASEPAILAPFLAGLPRITGPAA
jgi:hypothetical protein